MPATPSDPLRELARSFGVQVDYQDMSGRTKAASTNSLIEVLRALGADLSSESDAPRALVDRQLAHWRRRIDPVLVAWVETTNFMEVRLPASQSSKQFQFRLTSEEGITREWMITGGSANHSNTVEVGGEGFSSFRLPMPDGLTPGYYELRVAFDDNEVFESKVIAARRLAYSAPKSPGKRPWGIFCPLYALHGESSWGAGDFSDLERLIDWTAGLGGGLVASLPMLASNFDGPSPIISPYSPTSRLFWNEFYLDIDRIPELAHCEEARSFLGSEDVGRELELLRSMGLVDYGRQMSLKRSVLEKLAEWFFSRETDRRTDFDRYEAGNPLVKSYSFFQAAGETHGRNWRDWPAGLTRRDRVDPKVIRYHRYAQWQADEQLRGLASSSRDQGMTWYLDFPVGVDHNSFDVWSHREAFATGASVGCPPDPVFTKGQNWGFPPLHPDRQRESGYAYLIASFRNHLRHANALRIDHVMGLHRLFWIPNGAEAKDGAFVSTPAEEIYAILSVESHRHSAWLVGEDLGTVPPEVDSAMKQHNVRGMYVIQYEARPDPTGPLREVPESTVAGMNTHDMPPFAAFWGGLDLDDRKDLGLLDAERLEVERKVRDDQRSALAGFLRRTGMLAPDANGPAAMLKASWDWLAASPASVLLLNIEDLWLETESQNTPNTYDERPNWRRKLRLAFEQFSSDPGFLETLKTVDEFRSSPLQHGLTDQGETIAP